MWTASHVVMGRGKRKAPDAMAVLARLITAYIGLRIPVSICQRFLYILQIPMTQMTDVLLRPPQSVAFFENVFLIRRL